MILIDITASATREHASATNVSPPIEARSTGCALCELARALVAAGVPDQAWEAVNTASPGVVALRGPSIHALARLTIEAHPRRGLRFIAWKAPQNVVSPSPMRAGLPPHPDQRPDLQRARAAACRGVARLVA